MRTEQRVRAHLIQKAENDTTFRAASLENPSTTSQDEPGITCPGELTVHVGEDSQSTCHLVLPGDEIVSDTQREAIDGGYEFGALDPLQWGEGQAYGAGGELAPTFRGDRPTGPRRVRPLNEDMDTIGVTRTLVTRSWLGGEAQPMIGVDPLGCMRRRAAKHRSDRSGPRNDVMFATRREHPCHIRRRHACTGR